MVQVNSCGENSLGKLPVLTISSTDITRGDNNIESNKPNETFNGFHYVNSFCNANFVSVFGIPFAPGTFLNFSSFPIDIKL